MFIYSDYSLLKFAITFSVVVSAPSVGLAQVFLQPDRLDAVADPQTGSVWIQTAAAFRASIVGEWREDGSYTSHSGFFSGFNYRSQRDNPNLRFIESKAGYLNGEFGVFSGRGFYRRNQSGDWKVADLFDSVSLSGCAESPDKPTCAALDAGTDNRGTPYVTYFNPNAAVTTEYWKNGAYRPAAGAEASLQLFTQNLAQWLTADTFIIRDFDSATEAGRVPYMYHGPTASSRHLPKFVSPRISEIAGYSTRGSKIFALGSGRSGDPASSLSHIELMGVENPRDPEPLLRSIGRLTADTSATLLVPIDSDESVLYVGDGSLVRGLRLADGKETGVVSDCQTDPAVRLSIAPGDASSVWIACADEILQLQNGVVVQRGPISRSKGNSGKVIGGRILNSQPGALDAVLFFENSYAVRVRSSKETLTLRHSPVDSTPAGHVFSWLERDRPCGVFFSLQPGDSQRSLRCRSVTDWIPTDLGIGVPDAVRSFGNTWWALSTVKLPEGSRTRVFRRPYHTQRWELVGEFEAPKTGSVRFVPDARERAVLDTRDGSLWVWGDGKFDKRYVRELRFGQPALLAIDGQGQLFTACDAPNAGSVEICTVTENGQILKVAMPAFSLQGAAHPLRKGIVVGTKVIRSSGAIELDRMFGEFKAPIGYQLRLQAQPVMGGNVLLQARFESENSDIGPKSYLFDGMRIDEQFVTPQRYVKSQNGFIVSESGGGSSSGLALSNPAYQSEDGVWFAPESTSTPDNSVKVGLNPVDAWNRPNDPLPNFANDAVHVGAALLIGTDDGLWRCPSTNGTMLNSATASLPTTPGCLRLVALPFVTKLVSVRARENEAWRLVIMQGRRVLHVTQSLGGEIAVTPIDTPFVKGLSQDGSRVSWFTDRELITWDSMNDSNIRAALPESKLVKGANNGWVCTDRGLYWSNSLGDWLEANQKCLQMNVTDGKAFVIEERGMFRCVGDNQSAPKCEFLAPLPKPYLADSTRLGSLASPSPSTSSAAVSLAMGTTVYSWDDGSRRFVDVTPRGKNGSLLLTRVMALNAGVLALDGGGVFVLPAAAGSSTPAQHFRIE